MKFVDSFICIRLYYSILKIPPPRLLPQAGHVGVVAVLVGAVVQPLSAVVHLVLDVRIRVLIIVVQVVAVVEASAVRSLTPLVVRAPSCIHEKVAHGGGFEPQLAGNRHLHLFGGSLRLLKHGQGAIEGEWVTAGNSSANWCAESKLLVVAEAGRGRGREW